MVQAMMVRSQQSGVFFSLENCNSDVLVTRRSGCKMAAQIRQSLAGLLNSGLSPKELTEKYRKILNRIVELKNEELVEGLKSFIDAGWLRSQGRSLQQFYI